METIIMHERAIGQPERLQNSQQPAVAQRSLQGDFARIARPGLEYQHAFDYCAVEAHRHGGPVVVAASSTFYVSQLLGRVEACQPQITGADGTDAHTLAAGSARVVVWAEPEQATGAQALQNMRQLLDRDSRLYVIVSQPLARLLPEWRGAGQLPATRPAGLRRTIGWLQEQGWSIVQMYGFHGPTSIMWEMVGRLMDRAGRADLADRCHFKMRDTYIVGGAQVVLAPVAVLAATRSLTVDTAKEARP